MRKTTTTKCLINTALANSTAAYLKPETPVRFGVEI